MKRLWCAGTAFLLCLRLAPAQGPRFDAASVRIVGTGERRFFNEDAGTIDYHAITLTELLLRAFDIPLWQLTEPSSLRNPAAATYYTVTATMPPQTTKESRRFMLQSLLEERFRLVFHREDKSVPVYAIRIADTGLTTRKVDEQGAVCVGWQPGEPWHISDRIHCPSMGPSPFRQAAGGGMTIEELISHIPQLDRPLVDHTELNGFYDIELLIPRDTDTTIQASEVNDAMRKQLGLRLEKTTAEVDQIVIDHVDEKPTPN